MIIVEGFDTSGKSTLAAAIGKAISWPVVHTGGPTKDDADVTVCLHRSFQRMYEKVIQDRVTHISEACYSMLVHPSKAALALNAIPKDINSPTLVIYCRPADQVMINALDGHVFKAHDNVKHMTFLRDNAEEIISIYDAVMALVALKNNVIRYDRTRMNETQRIINIVKEWSKQ